MLNANGIEFRNEQGIFPVMVFQHKTQSFKCLGTSFFINGLGIFVTAKHVVIDNLEDIIMVTQQLSDHTCVNRIVTDLSIHPTADIAVGLVGIARHPMTAQQVDFEMAPNCRLSFNKMEVGTPLGGFGYSKTEKITNANLITFNFRGIWAQGVIEDYHAEGTAILKNKCYQTSMHIDSGCSGGPVFRDGYVVGINSSSMELTGEESPISFITPVDFLLDLELTIDGVPMSIKKIIQNGGIIVER